MVKPLWERMRAHPRAQEMGDYAANLEAAANGFYSEPQTHNIGQFVGAWARARRVWCDISGEPML